jgi:hypothetical protein
MTLQVRKSRPIKTCAAWSALMPAWWRCLASRAQATEAQRLVRKQIKGGWDGRKKSGYLVEPKQGALLEVVLRAQTTFRGSRRCSQYTADDSHAIASSPVKQWHSLVISDYRRKLDRPA